MELQKVKELAQNREEWCCWKSGLTC